MVKQSFTTSLGTIIMEANPITTRNEILLLTKLLRTLESNEPSLAQDHSH